MTDATARAQIVGAIFYHLRAVTEDGKPAGLVVDSVHDAVDAIMAVQGAHTVAAPPQAAGPALRWEGNDCHVGKMCLGRVYDRGDNWTFDRWLPRVVKSPGRSDIVDPHPTREDARAAVEAAIRDRLGIGAPDTRIATTLEAALRPFAAIADAPAWRRQVDECKVVTMHFGPSKWLSITLGDLRRAKAALGGSDG